MRGGVVTVATRTVADKREWDMVGSFRVVPGWRKVRAALLSGRRRGGVRLRRAGGRAVRPCPAVLMVMCTTVPP